MRQKNSFRLASYGVVYDETGRILLTKGSQRSVYPGAWFLPGGGVEHGEHPRDAVVREFAEETGLDVAVEDLKDVVSIMMDGPRGPVHTNAVLYGVRVTGGTLRPEPNGNMEQPTWLRPEEIAGQAMTPVVSRVLDIHGGPVTYRPDPPPIEPNEKRQRRGQRFGAYGVTTDADDNFLLARIADGYPGAGNWHLPGGGVDFGEQPRDAVTREVYEETGQHGEVGELLDVTSFRTRRAIGPEGHPLDWHGVRAIFRVFVAEPTDARVVEMAGGSTADARWWPRKALEELPLTPAVVDGLRLI
ncbi:hypothetical protein Afil01_13310 [Actinorhabdospora filicis]|uniref:Nudix hydrolase domain-containing protein n=1 Tax=Actinorhabdospora filicis TaxID=1785913 RepID=A0A9W6SJ58_9ACTN|nr:NUDIX domain-containing protein [Actinorhabdospora filicis]GLZ76524.1 hypothetical protein Afil01_13310 [Actinorhabdospora filicis]